MLLMIIKMINDNNHNNYTLNNYKDDKYLCENRLKYLFHHHPLIIKTT